MEDQRLSNEDRHAHVLSKWRMIAAFWALQALFVCLIGPIWLMQGDTVNGPARRPWGSWDWQRVFDVCTRWDYWGSILSIVLGLMFLQSVLVWPVRRPRARREKGWPLWLSLGAAALVGTGLAAVLLLGLYAIGQINDDFHVSMSWPWEQTILIAWCAVSYVLGALLMYAFCSRSLRAGQRHESVLGRIAATLFVGTLVEAMAIMPLDVMFRRRQECYSWAASFWAYIVLIGAGLVTIGPAILLPILAHRRKRWYGSRCDCCGYDMTGLLSADRGIERCPECGAGWKPEKGGTLPA